MGMNGKKQVGREHQSAHAVCPLMTEEIPGQISTNTEEIPRQTFIKHASSRTSARMRGSGNHVHHCEYGARVHAADARTGSAWPSGRGAERMRVWSRSSSSVGRPQRAGGSSGACPGGTTLARGGSVCMTLSRSSARAACKARSLSPAEGGLQSRQ